MFTQRVPKNFQVGEEVELLPTIFCIDDDNDEEEWSQLLSEYGNRFKVTAEIEPDMYYDIISLETEQEYSGISVDLLKAV